MKWLEETSLDDSSLTDSELQDQLQAQTDRALDDTFRNDIASVRAIAERHGYLLEELCQEPSR